MRDIKLIKPSAEYAEKIAEYRAILANGGQYECTNYGEVSHLSVELYWIKLY